MSDFQSTLDQHFPGALPEPEFVARMTEQLVARGFRADNTLPCVGVCRDELCRTLSTTIQEHWAQAFKLSALAGMLFVGRTGFRAARSHAPIEDGRERYLFTAMPHIGIGENGEIGRCERIGRPGHSKACGALVSFLNELESGTVTTATDPLDVEQSLLKQRLIRELPWARVPTLIELTKAAQRAIADDLDQLIRDSLDDRRDDWAVLNGIQIQGPGNRPYTFPGFCYSVVNGTRQALLL